MEMPRSWMWTPVPGAAGNTNLRAISICLGFGTMRLALTDGLVWGREVAVRGEESSTEQVLRCVTKGVHLLEDRTTAATVLCLHLLNPAGSGCGPQGTSA